MCTKQMCSHPYWWEKLFSFCEILRFHSTARTLSVVALGEHPSSLRQCEADFPQAYLLCVSSGLRWLGPSEWF